jgi:predicted nucleotidyltransferase
MLSGRDAEILSRLAAAIRNRFPEARVWAFGSRVRGDADLSSDFDICVVLDQIDQEKDRWIRGLAWEIGFENDRVITTIVMDSYEFERGPMSESALVAAIVQEGVAA